jgi:hypothetical protein
MGAALCAARWFAMPAANVEEFRIQQIILVTPLTMPTVAPGSHNIILHIF